MGNMGRKRSQPHTYTTQLSPYNPNIGLKGSGISLKVASPSLRNQLASGTKLSQTIHSAAYRKLDASHT